MHSPEHCFTRFTADTSDYELPTQFTFPFYYTPHPLCVMAAKQLQQHLLAQTDFEHDFGLVNEETGRGKMFGVLLIESPQGELGFLSAFSGKIADQNLIPGFVPPVYDMLTDEASSAQRQMPSTPPMRSTKPVLRIRNWRILKRKSKPTEPLISKKSKHSAK